MDSASGRFALGTSQQRQMMGGDEQFSTSTVRNLPPSALPSSSFRTPQAHSGQRAYSQRVSRSAMPPPSFGSPFLSPPSDAQIARNARTTPNQERNLYQQYRPTVADSPFQSPPPTQYVPRRPDPLVLDPSASRNQTSYSQSRTMTSPSVASPAPVQSNSLHTSGIASKLFEVATGRVRDQQPVHLTHSINYHSTPAVASNQDSAATLAQTAVKAGFLQKLGRNIPEFKRRFFLLRSETTLYYYLSPHDTEPRGRINLEEAQLEHVESLPDGRYRFQVLLDPARNGDGSFSSSRRERVVLEARSEELGHEWMKRMQSEQVSTLHTQVDKLISERQSQDQLIEELERRIENYKLIEKDRDGALEDAQQWKEQFGRLDESLRKLTRYISRSTNRQDGTKEEQDVSAAVDLEEEKKDADSARLNAEESQIQDQDHIDEIDHTPTKNNQSNGRKLVKDLEDTDSSVALEELLSDVPGTYFSGLANTCQQQAERLKLASKEAATAVDDLHEAQTAVETMKSRLTRAEQHLTKLWEENCAIRKSLKQKKREKKILVHEYKQLQAMAQELEQSESSRLEARRQDKGDDVPRAVTEEEDEHVPTEDTIVGSDEERLIVELEEHVASSIKLHERLVAANGFMDFSNCSDLNSSMADTVRTNHELHKSRGASAGSVPGHSPLQPTALHSKLTSLIDDNESETESDDEEDVNINEYQSMAGSIVSSVGAEFGSGDEYSQSAATIPTNPSATSTPERRNPLLQLDDEDAGVEEDENNVQQSLGSASIQFHPTVSKSVVTDTCHPTSRLQCPLTDVTEQKGGRLTSPMDKGDVSVYHLTFYTKKIGIQFQKAPPAPSKPKGLLTAALTADLADNPNGSDKTAAELRSVAAITSIASGRSVHDQESCPVSMPKDVVLVCGFQGFDESGTNPKPNLGARLVAFDGVSVEIGHWTFDSIRKAIKARGRPLTLSFRNDFLTTEQRAVLTKAVMEVDAKSPPPQHDLGPRPPSVTPSMNSTISHETEYFVNDKGMAFSGFSTVEQDLSAIVQEDDCCHEKLNRASSSVASGYGRLRRMSSGSLSTHQTNQTHQSNFRSFSEAGSSVTSSFAPLVANLVKRVGERKHMDGEFSPQYLRRADSLENTPQHQDFQSNLL